MSLRVHSARQRSYLDLAQTLATSFATRAAEFDRSAAFPTCNYAQMRDCGYTSLTVPRELGGLGANLLEMAIAQERLATGCGSTALAVNMHLSVVGQMARRWRTTGDERVEKLLRAVVQEGAIVAPITAEPGHALVRSTGSVARRTPGGYLVSGRKVFGTSSAVMTRLVSMAVDREHRDGPTVLFFNIPADAPGVAVVPGTWDTLGLRATRSDEVVLADVFVSEQDVYLRFPEGCLDGSLLQSLFGWAWPTFGAVYLGMAVGAFERCCDDIVSRGWDKRPGVQAMVSECVVLIEAAHAMVATIAREVMTNQLWQTMSVQEGMARVLLAKLVATNNAVTVVDRVMQILGTAAYRGGSHYERVYRDVRAATMHPYSNLDAIELLAATTFGSPVAPENPPRLGTLVTYSDEWPEGAPC